MESVLRRQTRRVQSARGIGAVHTAVAWRGGLLQACAEAAIPTAVVTNSNDDLIGAVRSVDECAPLSLIGTWFTRGKYTNAKPHPECYIESTRELLAARLAAADDDERIVVLAFEDSPRGLKAIVDARRHFQSSSVAAERRIELVPVFVSAVKYDNMDQFLDATYVRANSMDAMVHDEQSFDRSSLS